MQTRWYSQSGLAEFYANQRQKRIKRESCEPLGGDLSKIEFPIDIG
jgi:hypothetical protein